MNLIKDGKGNLITFFYPMYHKMIKSRDVYAMTASEPFKELFARIRKEYKQAIPRGLEILVNIKMARAEWKVHKKRSIEDVDFVYKKEIGRQIALNKMQNDKFYLWTYAVKGITVDAMFVKIILTKRTQHKIFIPKQWQDKRQDERFETLYLVFNKKNGSYSLRTSDTENLFFWV